MKYKILLISLISGLGLSCNPKTVTTINNNDGSEVPEENTDKMKKFKLFDPNETISETQFVKLNQDTSVKKGKLSNGLSYYIMQNTKPENRAELRLVVKAGSINEDPNQLGLAHFIEHMAFNGTENFSKNELVNYLESVGNRFGPDLNAYTSFDETVYMLQVRTDDEEQMEKGLLVLSDWASKLEFDEEEIDKERGVVISEWRSRLSPDQRMRQKYLPVLLHDSRYSVRLPIGDPDIVRNAKYSTIKKFYYNWYRPDLMAVVAVGDFNVNLIEELIQSKFEDVPKAIKPRRREEYSIPSHDETLVSVCSDPEAAFTQVRIVQKLPSKVVRSTGDFRNRVKERLFIEMISSRLSELTKNANPPYIFASADKSKDIGDVDTYSSFAVAEEGESIKALSSLIRENERVLLHGFTQSELQRAQKEIIKDAEKQAKEKDKTESRMFASRCINHFLLENPILAPEHYASMSTKFAKSIVLDEVNKLAEDWYSSSNRVVIITSQEKEGLELPSEKEVKSLFNKVRKEKIKPYLDETNNEPLLTKEIIGATILDEKRHKSGVSSIVLGNGAVVHFKLTDFNNDIINFSAISKGGHSIVGDEDFFNARFAPAVIEQSGLANFSRVDLSKMMAGKDVSLNASVGEYFHELKGEAAPEDLKTLLEFIVLEFSALRKDKDAFKSFQRRQGGIYDNILSDPGYYYSNEMRKILASNDPRSAFPTSADINAMEENRIHEIFETLYGNPSDFDFYFVGNLDEKLKSQILNYIGSLVGKEGELSYKKRIVKFPESGTHRWKKGEAPKSYVTVAFNQDIDSEDEDTRTVLKGLRDVMNIRLREVLREDKGGVYGVRVSESSTLIPEPKSNFYISFNTDPQAVDDLLSEVNNVVEEVMTEGPKPGDIIKIKEMKKQQLIKQFKENGFWINSLTNNFKEEKSFDNLDIDYQLDRLNLWSGSAIQNVAMKIFGQGKKVVIVQDPE